MAMTQPRSLHPKLPDLAHLDGSRFALEFDRPSDTLYWDFYGEPRSAIAVPVTDHVLYSVDPETEAVVGFQIEGFLARFVYEAPAFLDLADRLGLTPIEVADIRERLSPNDRQGAALRAILGAVAVERGVTAPEE
jgi:hypothetical protein